MSGSSPEPKLPLSQRLKATLLSVTPARIDGFVDSAVANEILGWAFDAGRPNRKVHVVARHLDTVIAEALADLPRRDLLALGKGDGRCGFRLRIPGDLPETVRASIVVEAVAKPRNIRLKRGRFALQPAQAAPATAQPRESTARCGFIERYVDGEVSGWAVDPQQPEQPARVDVFDGERFLGVALSDKERPGLSGGRAPAGARGFSFKVPSGDVEPANLRARLSGTRLELGRSKNFLSSERSNDADNLVGASSEETSIGLLPAQTSRPAGGPSPLLARAQRSGASGVAFLICGTGAQEDLGRTIASCQRQTSEQVEWRRLAEGAASSWSDLGHRRYVVFLKPGQEAHSALAESLTAADGLSDALTWDAQDVSHSRFPRAAASIGQLRGAFALRGSVAANLTAEQFLLAAAGDIDALARSILKAGLRWSALPAQLSSSLPPAPPPAIPQVPKRTSLALWGIGKDETPAILSCLRDARTDIQVELLVSSDEFSPSLVAATEELAAVTTVRIVDPPERGAATGRLRALTQAATGEVVILCRADVAPTRPGFLQELSAWAIAPGIGAVTSALAPSSAPPVSGLDIVDHRDGDLSLIALPPAEGISLVAAAPVELVAVSRKVLAMIGGLDGSHLRPTEIALAQRLDAEGFATIALGGLIASVDAPLTSQTATPHTERLSLSAAGAG